jgi:hypothetical protein
MPATKLPIRREAPSRHGEDWLSAASIDIKLETGDVVTFGVLDEVGIPPRMTGRQLVLEAERSPARLAFWSRQAARAASQLRRQELELQRKVGSAALVYREQIDKFTDRKSNDYGLVDNYVDSDRTVQDMRLQVCTLRKHCALIESIRDAVEHRTYILRLKLKNEIDANYRS